MDILYEIFECPEEAYQFRHWTSKGVVSIAAIAYLGIGTERSQRGARQRLETFLTLKRMWGGCTDLKLVHVPPSNFVREMVDYMKWVGEYYSELGLSKGEVMKRFLNDQLPPGLPSLHDAMYINTVL